MQSPINTQVIDTILGKPAKNVNVVLETQADNSEWKELARSSTNTDGKIEQLLPENFPLKAGFYSLIFDTKSYYQAMGLETFYPVVPIIIEIKNQTEQTHITLSLSPYGYSTHKGR
ncbi:MAG: hydroxyisourate hydrolase [Ignavibacteriales bacterium]|nr:hydroxyisourate hydrolase [Ignavibacteriales bacterium]